MSFERDQKRTVVSEGIKPRIVDLSLPGVLELGSEPAHRSTVWTTGLTTQLDSLMHATSLIAPYRPIYGSSKSSCKHQSPQTRPKRLRRRDGHPHAVPDNSQVHCRQGHDHSDEEAFDSGVGNLFSTVQVRRSSSSRGRLKLEHLGFVLEELAAQREDVALHLPGMGQTPLFAGEVTVARKTGALKTFLRLEGLSAADQVGSSLSARLAPRDGAPRLGPFAGGTQPGRILRFPPDRGAAPFPDRSWWCGANKTESQPPSQARRAAKLSPVVRTWTTHLCMSLNPVVLTLMTAHSAETSPPAGFNVALAGYRHVIECPLQTGQSRSPFPAPTPDRKDRHVTPPRHA